MPCDGSCSLADVPTRDLVAELATREGVQQLGVGVTGFYQILITHFGMGSSQGSDFGPATILVVVD